MVHFTGANLYVSFKGTAISGDQTSYNDDEEMGMVDTSAGADAARTYLNTLLDGTAKVTAYFDTTATAATDPYNLCAPGAEGTLIVGPEGTAAGKPKKTLSSVRVKKRSRKIPYDDNVEMDLEFQYSSAPSDGTW